MQTLQEVQAIYDNWEQKVCEETRKDALEEGRKDGLEEGEKKGLEKGEKKGLERGIRTLCKGFGIEMTDERERHLAAADLEQLENLMFEVLKHRKWPAA